eukprot:2346137-Rhodomonas_salina.1
MLTSLAGSLREGSYSLTRTGCRKSYRCAPKRQRQDAKSQKEDAKSQKEDAKSQKEDAKSQRQDAKRQKENAKSQRQIARRVRDNFVKSLTRAETRHCSVCFRAEGTRLQDSGFTSQRV